MSRIVGKGLRNVHLKAGINVDALAQEIGYTSGARGVAGLSGAIGHSCRAMGMAVPGRYYSNYKMKPHTVAVFREALEAENRSLDTD